MGAVRFRGPVDSGWRTNYKVYSRASPPDDHISDAETARIRRWLEANSEFAETHPFDEIAKHLEQALSDGVLTLEEADDLSFVIGKYTTVNRYFDGLRAGVQSLLGGEGPTDSI